MTSRPSIRTAVEYLRSHRIVFEAGLTDAEITKVEEVCGCRLPPDFRVFLQTALPVTGGFPNWRSESENDLRHRYLDRPARGILFDVEHNDFWPEVWGPRLANLADALAEAGRRLHQTPRLVPVRSHHFLPATPSAEGNPVFSVRQTDITCVGCDLTTYLMSLFGEDGDGTGGFSNRSIPFWTEIARTSRVRVPNLAGAVVGGAEREYADLCRAVQLAGFWAEVVPLGNGEAGVTFDRTEPTGDRKHGLFWLSRRDFGWLLCIRCPRFYFAPEAERIPELCLALLNELPHEELNAGRLPFWNFRLADPVRREFGLVAIHHFTDHDDERERKVRAWERLGWREMSHGQMDEAWSRYGATFGYPERGVFTTPMPSVTWDISPIYLRAKEDFERLEGDLTLKALAALKECTRTGQELLALDWNHPCYFFDPHGGVSDASPSSWAVPVLPNGDHYLFLAQDFKFGIIGNCVDMTICVFGPELQEAFAADPPLIFNKPTWSYEQRREKERRWAEQGWQRLSVDEKEDIWERFDSQFDFYRRKANPDSPAISEPTPSLTWAIASTQARHEEEVADLTLKLLAGFQAVTRPGERLYALDWLHWYEHYTFDPHRLASAGRDSWALTAYPDDNYAIFLAPDFRFGVFGNPLEQTLCIFGRELLEAMGDDLPIVLGSVVRKNGKGISS
jgi:hypothetical protein